LLQNYNNKSANISYYMVTGPNSDSYTMTMLDKCNILAMKPHILAY
jgi:hypothetical protein